MASYEKSKSSGLWSVRFRVTLADGSVKQPRLSGFKTKKEAIYAYEDYLKNKDTRIQANHLDIGSYYFEDFLQLFYEYKKGRVKESTIYDITKKINTRILPFFERRRMRDISPANILEWQGTLNGFSYGYIKTLHVVLGSIWTFANKYYDLPNVCKKVDRPRNLQKKKEMQIYTPEQFNKLLAHIGKAQYYHYFKFLYLSGCRPEEGCAVTWTDINLNTGAVVINKSITYKAKDPGKFYQVTTPKNLSSDRTVYIPLKFCEQLREYKDWQTKTLGECRFVFTNKIDPLPPASVKREMKLAAERAGLHRIRVHDLRHSCASLLIHHGASIVAISHLFGHSSPQVTWDTYAHMFPDDQERVLEIMSEYS